jgi:multidrug resistance efflux pump
VTAPVNEQPTPVRFGRLISGLTQVIVSVSVLLIACMVFYYLFATRPRIQITNPERPLMQVQAIKAVELPLARQWRGFGTARAMDWANVSSEVPGVVADVPSDIEPGMAVKRGQVIARLDGSEYRAVYETLLGELAEAKSNIQRLEVEEGLLKERLKTEEAELAINRRDLERTQRLLGSNAATSKDVENAERQVIASQRAALGIRMLLDAVEANRIGLVGRANAQKQRIAVAELNMQRTTVVSPIDGWVSKVHVEKGVRVAPGDVIARVVNLSKIEVPVRLAASARQDIKTGNAAKVKKQTAGAVWVDGYVSRVSPEDDESTRTMTAYVVVEQAAVASTDDDSPGRLWPGEFLAAVVNAASEQTRVVLPVRSIQMDRAQVLREGRVVSTPVSVLFEMEGAPMGDQVSDIAWMVLGSGVEPGETVLLTFNRGLGDGTQVLPIMPGEHAVPQPEAGLAESGLSGAGQHDAGQPESARPAVNGGEKPAVNGSAKPAAEGAP